MWLENANPKPRKWLYSKIDYAPGSTGVAGVGAQFKIAKWADVICDDGE